MATVLLLALLWARAAEAGECNQPSKLENGLLQNKYLQQKTFPSGSKVYYTCNPGYTFSQYSRRSITCIEGVWEPLQATCTPKSCGSPGEILNGYYRGNNTFGSTVTFFCNEGYTLVGRNYRMCDVNGWGGQVPTCEVVKCPDIPAIENGRISRPSTESWEYGMVADVSCEGDYSLIGERKLICKIDGSWSHPFPKCKDVKCLLPDFAENVKMVLAHKYTYKYQEQISFRCKEGYEMEGNSVIVCGEDGNFSPPPPTCTPRKCNRPPELENGLLENKYINQEKFPNGSKVYYTCNPGYTFSQYSRRSITCIEGVWGPLRATCTPKSCGSPGEILNGYYRGSNTFGSTITFFCNEGYTLVGRNNRLCDVNGWGGQVPKCEVVKCPDIPAIENGRISRPSTESWEYGMVAEVSCEGDYSLIGERKLTCESDGRWSHPFPKCKDVKCPLPDYPENVEMVSAHKYTYKYQEQISFRCKEGYEMDGNSVIVCGEDGNFSPPPPTCTPLVKCPDTPAIENGRISRPSTESWEYGMVAEVSCEGDYSLIGERKLTCESDGSWSHPFPKCKTSKLFYLYLLIPGTIVVSAIGILIWKRPDIRRKLMRNKKRDPENGEALSNQMEHLAPAKETK